MPQLSPKPLIKQLAKGTKLTGLDTQKFKKRLEEALPSAGFGKEESKKIATGFRSGTLKLSKERTTKLLKAFKSSKFLPNVRDISGTVNKFAAKQNQPKIDKAKMEKVAREKVIAERIKNRNIYNRQEELRAEAAKQTIPTPVASQGSQNLEFQTPINLPSDRQEEQNSPLMQSGFGNSALPQYQNPFEHPIVSAQPAKKEDEPPDMPLD